MVASGAKRARHKYGGSAPELVTWEDSVAAC